MQLTQALRRLRATGHNGFEGLIHRLVERLTGYSLHLARSGDQSGRDMRSGGAARSIIAVECKRYGESTELEQAELVGKLAEAKTTLPMLDIWVLVASRPVPDQIYTAIERLAKELRVGFVIVSTEHGSPSRLAALCANASDVVRTFLSGLPDVDLDMCDEELRQIQADHRYEAVRAGLERDFSRSATYEWWRRHGHQSFINSFASPRASHAAFGQLLDVRAKTASSQLVTRVDAQGRLNRWYDDWPASHKAFALLGEEGDGKTWAVASWLMERCQTDSNFPPILWLSSYRVTTKDPRLLMSDAWPRSWSCRPGACQQE